MNLRKTTFDTYNIGVKNTLYYQCEVIISNTRCLFNFGWNSRLGKRWLSVTSSNGAVLLPQSFITLGYIYQFNINFEILGDYKTFLYFQPKKEGIATGVIDWENNVEIRLLTLSGDEAVQERWNETNFNVS